MGDLGGTSGELADLDLTSPTFWSREPTVVDGVLAVLRTTDPWRRCAEPPVGALGPGPGFVALTRHEDIAFVSRRTDLFASGNADDLGPLAPLHVTFHDRVIGPGDSRHHQAARILSRARGRPADGAESGPAHARFRRVVSAQMTPARVTALLDEVRRVARELVDDVCERGECDLVTDVAALLPLRVLFTLLGLPRTQERFVLDRTNTILSLSDPTYAPDRSDDGIVTAALTAGAELGALLADIVAFRRRSPGDDLVTALAHAEIDGALLDDAVVTSYCSILLSAGNETTRHAIANGATVLADHPAEWARCVDEPDALDPAAVDEILRLATPVTHFRRTCVADGTRIGDVELAAGEHVVLWYRAGNQDPTAFAEPGRLDLRRVPNEHQSFGAPGAHFCLGAHLARREVGLGLREITTRLPDLEVVDRSKRIESTFVNGFRHLPVRYSPSAPVR